MWKSISSYITYLFLPLAISQCSSGQQMVQKAPFVTGEVYFEQWIAGVQGGGSGIDFYLPIINMPTTIQLEKVYFRGKVAAVTLLEDKRYIARFATALNRQRDLTLHADPIEEQVNTPPKHDPFPVELQESEAGIFYLQDGKPFYTIIKNVIEKESIPRPSVLPGGDIDKG